MSRKWDPKANTWVDTSPVGKSSQQPTIVTSNPELQRLIWQNKRLDARAKQDKGGPSVLSRVFDVLSRGQYASAEWTRKSQEAQRKGHGGFFGLAAIDDAAKGAWAGLSGKKKTSYSQVLDEAGVKNKLVKGVGGLVGDVALDLTTYTGAGLVKTAAKEGVENVGTKVAARVLSNAQKAGTIKHAGETARLVATREAVKSGVKLSKKEIAKAGKEGEKDFVEGLLNSAKGIAEKRTASAPTRLEVNFAGKNILPKKAGELAYKAGSAPLRAAGNTSLGEDLGKLFQNSKTFGILNEPRKAFHGQAVSDYYNFIERYGFDKINLTNSEAKQFSKAFEAGNLDLLPLSSKHGVNYAELAEKVKAMNHEMYVADLHAGIIPSHLDDAGNIVGDVPELDNYLYHMYRGADKSGFKAKRKKVIASDSFKPAVERKIPTLQDAASAGLDPETNILTIMRNRVAKSTQAHARAGLVKDAAKQFGMELDEATAKLMKKNGHDIVNLKSILKDDKAGAVLGYLPDNVYVNKEIAQHLGGIEKLYNSPDELKSLIGLFDKVQSKWKSAATVYNPGHHVRNAISDVFLNYLDGVKNPAVYDKAMSLTFGGGKALTGKTRVGKDLLDNNQLMRLFRESGAAPGFIQAEELSKGVTHAVTSHIHKFSQNREQTGRLAHFIDVFTKEAKGIKHGGVVNDDLIRAAQNAAARVRKWNIDYNDLTDFEKNVMKRVLPFYTWLRKSTPLMIEAMATRPGKVAAVPKGLSAVETLLGVDPDDKLPTDLIPKWMREMGGIQLGSHGENPVFGAPPLPVMEPGKMLEGGTQGIIGNLLSQTSPMIRGPIEVGTGRALFSGAPLPSMSEYLMNQIPAARQIGSVRKNSGDPDKDDTMVRILNYLSGAGLYEMTPNRLKGEQQRQMDPKQAAVRKGHERMRNG